MSHDGNQLRTDLADLVGERPGWRLEVLSRPGAAPLWCYGQDGHPEFSVTAEEDRIRLSAMASDGEISFEDAASLTAWLAEHRPDALRDPPVKLRGKARFRSFFEWS
jgi:hypothetical protein